MPSIPCIKSENRCFPCADDSSNPLANLSLEPPDTNLFPCVVFYSVVNVVPNVWQRTTCVGFDESSTSQTDACDRALRRAKECIPEPPVPPKDPPPPPPPPPPEPPPPPAANYTFCNDAVTCQSGSNCYTLPECTVFGNSKADANAIAQSICEIRVHDPALASPCGPPVVPPAPPPLPPSECPSEVGAAIDSLEITSETTWIASQTINDPPWTIDGPALRLNTYDLPPGEYKIHNLDGYVDVPTGGICPVGNATTLVYPGLLDDESTILSPNQCTLGPFCPAPSEEDGMRINCEFEVDFNVGGERLNGTGACYFICNPSQLATGGGGYTVGEPHIFSLKQPSGLIPQPRKVAIADYAALISQFADPVAAAGWNGEFNTRDTYTSMVLDWQVVAGGSFGGAKLSYITTHPTSFNGKGWQLDIFSPGMILMWRGFRGVGADPLGYFFKHSPSTVVGPDCILCTDNSDIPWEPS